MKAKDLQEWINSVPPESDIVIARPFVIDDKGQLTGVLDCPIVGMAVNESDNELRFMIDLESVKKCFKPSDVKFLEGGDGKDSVIRDGIPRQAPEG